MIVYLTIVFCLYIIFFFQEVSSRGVPNLSQRGSVRGFLGGFNFRGGTTSLVHFYDVSNTHLNYNVCLSFLLCLKLPPPSPNLTQKVGFISPGHNSHHFCLCLPVFLICLFVILMVNFSD